MSRLVCLNPSPRDPGVLDEVDAIGDIEWIGALIAQELPDRIVMLIEGES